MKCSEIDSAANCAASRLLLSAILVAVFHPASAQTTTPVRRNPATHAWSVRWQPAQLVNGSPIVFQITPPSRLTALTGKWLTHDVSFSYDPAGRTWYGIAGTSLETRSGAYTLELRGTAARNEVLFSRKMIVRKAKYPTIAVTVAKKYTEPSPEQMERINQDKTVKKDVFSHTDPEREWSGKFRPPVEAKISDVFGTQRVFNGKVQSMHQGLDYAVPGGTPVSAVNAGTVLLAGPLYFEGNCVVLDHGQGLMTLYLHLSEIKVKQGEKIEGGQQIGLSGGTGRASGPHLHLAVRWQGVYLNPAILLSLRLP